MPPNGPHVIAYLPHTEDDRTLLSLKGLEHDRFFVLPDQIDFDPLYQFEVFSRYGATSFFMPAGEMIPICRDEEYGDLFTVSFFADNSPIIYDAPTTAIQVIRELQPLIQSGCVPFLFTKMSYPFGPSMEPLAPKIALERTVGFIKEDDAILAQVIAEGRKNER